MRGKDSLIIFDNIHSIQIIFKKSVTKQSGKPTDIVRGSTMPVPLLVCSKGSNACSDITIGDATTTTCCCDSDLCNHAQTVQQQSRLVYGIFAVVAMSVYRIFH